MAKSLLKAGGQGLQDECTSYVTRNGKLSPGDIVATGPGKLPCKKVVHTVGMLYNGRESEKVNIYSWIDLSNQQKSLAIKIPYRMHGSLDTTSRICRIMQ